MFGKGKAKAAPAAEETDSERNLRLAIEGGATVVPTVGLAVGQHLGSKEVSQKIEGAMMAALQKAQAEGVNDQEELRRRMMIARDEAR